MVTFLPQRSVLSPSKVGTSVARSKANGPPGATGRAVVPRRCGRVHDRSGSALALAAAVTSAYQIASNFRR